MSTTIISDSYALFGTVTSGPPDRPEPPRREPVWLDKAALLKRQKWDEATFEAALALPDTLRFPRAGQKVKPGSFTVDLAWRDTEVEKWEARLREHHDTVARLLGRTK